MAGWVFLLRLDTMILSAHPLAFSAHSRREKIRGNIVADSVTESSSRPFIDIWIKWVIGIP